MYVDEGGTHISTIPSWMTGFNSTGGDFSMFAWIYIPGAPVGDSTLNTGFGGVAAMKNVAGLRLRRNSTTQMRLAAKLQGTIGDDFDEMNVYSVNANITDTAGWYGVWLSYDHSELECTYGIVQLSTGEKAVNTFSTVSGHPGNAAGACDAAGSIRDDATASTLHAGTGDSAIGYGLTVFRDETITEAQVDAIVAAADYFGAIYDLGSGWDGLESNSLVLNLGMAITEGNNIEVGDTVTQATYSYLDPSKDANMEFADLNKALALTDTPKYRDHHTPVSDAWTKETTPLNGVSAYRRGPGGRALRLLTDDLNTGEVLRVGLWWNSRGTRRNKDLSDGPDYGQNSAAGMARAFKDRWLGSIGCPLNADNGGGTRVVGFDGKFRNSAGAIALDYNSGYTGWQRAWTGSPTSSTSAPGVGAILPSGDRIEFKATPITDSLLVTGVDWTWEFQYLKGPGLGQIDVVNVVSATSQANAGLTGGLADSIDTDTEAATYTWQAGDAYNHSTGVITLNDAADAANFEVGHFVHVTGGTAADDGSKVSAIDGATITLEFPIAAASGGFSNGDTFSIGPLEVETYKWTSSAPANSVYQGLRLQSNASVGNNCIVLSCGAYRDDGTAGIITAPLGWSGNGYGNQLDEMYEGAVGDICRELDFDVVFFHEASQGTDAAELVEFAGLVPATVERIGIGDVSHGAGDARTTNGNRDTDGPSTLYQAMLDNPDKFNACWTSYAGDEGLQHYEAFGMPDGQADAAHHTHARHERLWDAHAAYVTANDVLFAGSGRGRLETLGRAGRATRT